jgi:hypothetical protein
MAVSMKIAVVWVIAPCSLVEVYQRFRGPCCLHHQGVYDVLNCICIIQSCKLALKMRHDCHDVIITGYSHVTNITADVVSKEKSFWT